MERVPEEIFWRKYDRCTNDRLDIQCFEIREDNHKSLTDVGEHLVRLSVVCRHIDDRRDGVADDVDRDGNKDREKRRDEGREKEDNAENDEEFEVDVSDGDRDKSGDRGFRDPEGYEEED